MILRVCVELGGFGDYFCRDVRVRVKNEMFVLLPPPPPIFPFPFFIWGYWALGCGARLWCLGLGLGCMAATYMATYVVGVALALPAALS